MWNWHRAISTDTEQFFFTVAAVIPSAALYLVFRGVGRAVLLVGFAIWQLIRCLHKS
jgi:hypothetical protein